MGTEVDWGALFQTATPTPTAIPVGEVCNHRIEGWAHIYKLKAYAEDEHGQDIFYHGSHLVRSRDNTLSWEYCGKPEAWRWNYYLARCGECGTKFSNPWLPICGDCWTDEGIYPSWQYVIAQETACGQPDQAHLLTGWEKNGRRSTEIA
jgi:hypothetical protein